MTRWIAKVVINIPDDSFQPGQCRKCPLKQVNGHETANRDWEEKISCGIGFFPATCPLSPTSGKEE